MKHIKSFCLIIMTAILSLCTIFGIQSINASAATIYTSSERDYWVFTSGSGDYTVSLDNPATCNSAYIGVETVITPATGVKDVGITLKGMVNPMQKMVIYHDNQVSGVADADAIVYTYTSLTDPDRQISVIATHKSTRTWYTLALTDELEVRLDSANKWFTYIAGTEHQTLGLKSDGTYTNAGMNYNYATSSKAWGALYQGALEFIINADGEIKYNSKISIGNVTNTQFLADSKAALAGTKYEERYTSEYVAETLTQLAKGARMEIKYYGVKSEKVDFHIRNINGFAITDGSGVGLELITNKGDAKYLENVKHSLITYKKVNTLYVGETYKLSDLVYGGGFTFRNAENANGVLKLSGYYAKGVNQAATADAGATYYNALTQMSNKVTMNEAGTYNMTMTGSFLGRYIYKDFTTSFSFNVVSNEPEVLPPTVTAVENVKLVGKTSYDLASFFTVENADTVTYLVDGVEVADSAAYVADGKDHTIVCTAENASGQSATATISAKGVWVGDKFFTASNGTVDYFTLKASTSGGSNTGVRTEISGVTEDNLTLTYNQTLSAGLGSGEMFSFDKYTNAAGEKIAIADMVVITYTSLADPTKQLSVISYNNGSGYSCTTIAFTNDVEYSNKRVYIAGTTQEVVGLRDGAYTSTGYASTSGPVFGAGHYYIDINSDGAVRHNNASTTYANILSADYLSASRAKLDASNPYYNRYTEEYAQEVLTAVTTDKCMLTISYYGLNEERTEDVIGFNIFNINNTYLGATDKTFTLTHPYSFPNKSTLYVGESYTIGELLDVYSAYRVNGVVTAVMEGYTDANNVSEDTKVDNKTVFTKTFTPTTAGTWSIKVKTRCAPSGQSWSDRYLEQIITFNVACKLNVEVEGETTVKEIITSSYVLPEVNVDGKVLLGWEYNGTLYSVGSTIEITSSEPTIIAKTMSFETLDVASARISEQSGLRFTTYMDKEGFEDLDGLTYSFYTLITSKHSTKSVKIDIDPEKIFFDEKAGQYTFRAALVDILPENYTRIYYAESYMVLTYADGSTKTIKTETIDRTGRSYAYVIEAAANDYQDTSDEVNYPYAVTVNGETKYAPVSAGTFNAINQINNTIQATAVKPYITIEFNGEDVTAAYKTQITAYFQSNPAMIGEEVDISEMVQQLCGDGYTLDLENSVYAGTMTTRGLDLHVCIIEDNFVEEGASEYSIVYANDVDPYAASIIKTNVQQVTGATLPVTADSGVANERAKVISIGSTALKKN